LLTFDQACRCWAESCSLLAAPELPAAGPPRELPAAGPPRELPAAGPPRELPAAGRIESCLLLGRPLPAGLPVSCLLLGRLVSCLLLGLFIVWHNVRIVFDLQDVPSVAHAVSREAACLPVPAQCPAHVQFIGMSD
jgi:hypothetical protein